MRTIKFNLKNNFTLVPEGIRTLEIISCEATPSGNPDKIKLTYKDTDGGQIREVIDLSKAIWKLSILCNVALGVQDGEEMDVFTIVKELLGKKIKCEVIHREGTQAREDGTLPKFANISKIISLVNDTPIETIQNPRSSIANDL